jgi:hypothetical protein
MISEEQVRVQLTLDNREFNAAMGQSEKGMEHFGKEGHKWFEHVGSSGRAFHKVMEDISEQSPLMGQAIKIALSPVVGILTTVTIAFSFFKKELEEWNKQMDEASERAAKPFSQMKEAMFEAEEELLRLDRSYRKFKEHTPETDAAFAAAADKTRLARINDLQSNTSSNIKRMEEEIKQAEKDIERRREKLTSQAGQGGFGGGGNTLEMVDERARIEEEELRIAERKKLLGEYETSAHKELLRLKGEQLDLDSKLEDARDRAKEDARYIYEQAVEEFEIAKKLNEERKKGWEYQRELREEQRREILDRKEKLANLQREADDAQKKARESRDFQYAPTLHEIATSGKWDMSLPAIFRQAGLGFTASPGAKIAQEVEKLQADAADAALYDTGGIKSDRYKKDVARIDVLKKQLVDMGLLKDDTWQKELNKNMAELVRKASEDGLKIQVADEGGS